MSYTHQVVTSLADAITKLDTFLSGTPGWTTYLSTGTGRWSARKTGAGFDIGIAIQWDTSDPLYIGIYQWHGAAYNSSYAPWDQNDDSGSGGQGTTNAILDDERSARLDDTVTEMWVFEDDHYFNAVLVRDGYRYLIFGAGVLEKVNDWTGGEYVYGTWVDNNYSSNQAVTEASTFLLDGLAKDMTPGHTNQEQWVATLRIEGMDDQPASGKYGVVMGDQSSSNLGTDNQGVAGGSRTNVARIHILGGYRAGPFTTPFSLFRGTLTKGLNPMYPIPVFHWNRTTGNVYGPLGQMKDVRGMNIRDFEPGQEFTVGSDTWTCFPASRKADDPQQSGVAYTQYLGVAFKKVTT